MQKDPSPDDVTISEKLRILEANQVQILQMLEGSRIPHNARGVQKISTARTVLFLNELLPQVYLTLVSVLQGVALAVLVDQFPLDISATNVVLLGYAVSSFLIIVAFWHSYLAAIFDGRWPFRFVDTLLFFIAAASESLAIRSMWTPNLWCVFIGIMCVIVAIIYFRQVFLLSEVERLDLFEDNKEAELRIRSVKTLSLFFVAGAVVSFGFVPITSVDPNNMIAPILAVVVPGVYILFVVRGAARFGINALG